RAGGDGAAPALRHRTMQFEDRAAAGALEEEREDPVHHAGKPGDDHAAADAGGESEMLTVGLTDSRRMAGELLEEGHGSVRLADERCQDSMTDAEEGPCYSGRNFTC